MKSRKTPPTKGLVGIAMHVLFCIFIFGFGRAVAVDLAITPLADPIGGIVGTELHIGGNIHDPKHVHDVCVGRVNGDVSLLGFLHEVDLQGVLMPPVLNSSFNGELADLTGSDTSILEETDDGVESCSDSKERSGNHADKKSGLTIGEILKEQLHWGYFWWYLVCCIVGVPIGRWVLAPAFIGWYERRKLRS